MRCSDVVSEVFIAQPLDHVLDDKTLLLEVLKPALFTESMTSCGAQTRSVV
jgi:hypothetical protein